MVGISGGGGGGGGYNYVQDSQPADPTEGEEWYDTGANAAFVYDGAAWIEQTVVDHGQLSGIAAADHHSRYTDGEAAAAAPVTDVSGATGSVRWSFGGKSGTSGTTVSLPAGAVPQYAYCSVDDNNSTGTIRFYYSDGSNESRGGGTNYELTPQDFKNWNPPAGQYVTDVQFYKSGGGYGVVDDWEINYIYPG